MSYRKDIDGLRALAITLVLLFHLGIEWIPSGFIGVDVFFVISGFLISGIAAKQLDEGRFSATRFYANRLLRLQPAFIMMLLVVLATACLFYLPEDLVTLFKSSKYASLFLSNQFFSRETTAYAASDSVLFLLLHTWSLSIEWQWYLIFPFAIILFYKLPGKNHLKMALGITAICYVISLIYTAQNGSHAYYSLTARAFEFMLGVSSAFLSRKICVPQSKWIALSGVIALVMIVIISLQNSVIIGYPNAHTLLVCLLTCLLLIGGNRDSFCTRLLSTAPLVYLGKISYSLYLWHWPVISLFTYLSLTSPLAKGIELLLILSLTLVSYHFVEYPFRRAEIKSRLTIPALTLLPAIVLLAGYQLAQVNYGWPVRLGAQFVSVEKRMLNETPELREKCFNSKTMGMEQVCKLGKTGSANKALLIGDSNSNHFWSFFDVLARQANLEITALASSSCLALPDVVQLQWSVDKKINTTCKENTDYYFNLIKSHDYKTVIIGERWDSYNGYLIPAGNDPAMSQQDTLIAALNKAYDSITAAGAKLVLVKEIEQMPVDYMGCYYAKFKTHHLFSGQHDDCSFTRSEPSEWIEGVFSSFAAAHPDVKFISPAEAQCPNGFCPGEVDGLPVYRDIGHITDHASKVIGQNYLLAHPDVL